MNAPMPMIVVPQMIGTETVQAVDARELHEFLGVATPFRDWITRRISTCGFAEGSDFHAELRESPGGRPSKEFAISVSMAKELSMVERGEKGKQARAYFLECERRAKAAAQQVHALPAAVDARLARLEQQMAVQGTKAGAFDRLTDQRGALNLTATAKVLGIAPRQLPAWLSTRGWIYRARDYGDWLGRQDKIDAGYLIHRLHPIKHTDGFERMHPQVRVTARGVARLAELLEQDSCSRTPMPIHSSPY